MKPLCVIPARAGSKRLPAKNIAPLGGKPLLAWTIEAARESGIFDCVYVSTEDETIAVLAEKFGADASIRRPAALAGDEVTNVQVSLHLFDSLEAMGRRYDAIVCLQPSSPLRNGPDIHNAWDLFMRTHPDFLVSATPIDPHYFHWALKRDEDGRCAMVFGERYVTVRQKLPEFFRPNGAIKIARPDALRQQNNFFGNPLAISLMDEAHSVHVAVRYDLALCEFYRSWQATQHST